MDDSTRADDGTPAAMGPVHRGLRKTPSRRSSHSGHSRKLVYQLARMSRNNRYLQEKDAYVIKIHREFIEGWY